MQPALCNVSGVKTENVPSPWSTLYVAVVQSHPPSSHPPSYISHPLISPLLTSINNLSLTSITCYFQYKLNNYLIFCELLFFFFPHGVSPWKFIQIVACIYVSILFPLLLSRTLDLWVCWGTYLLKGIWITTIWGPVIITCWMASPTGWAWVWVNSGSWWWTGRPGVLRFMGAQRVTE